MVETFLEVDAFACHTWEILHVEGWVDWVIVAESEALDFE